MSFLRKLLGLERRMPIITNWKNWVPTYLSGATVTTNKAIWRRVGQNFEAQVWFQPASLAGSTAGINLPPDLTMAKGLQNSGFTLTPVGEWVFQDHQTSANNFMTVDGSDLDTMHFSYAEASGAYLYTKQIWTNIFNSGGEYYATFSVPIYKWTATLKGE